MDKRKMRIFFLTGIMACFSFLLSCAQPNLKTTVDKNEILIGGQLRLTIEAGFSPEEYKINLPVIPDSLQHFEVIGRGKIDSLYSNDQLTGIAQTITLTSFDSGKWVLPSFLVNAIPAKGDSTLSFFTDSLPITVSFSMSDSTHELKDIKPIREVETTSHLWYWIAAGIAALAVIIFLVRFFRKRKKPATDTSLKSKLSPYDEAMQELEKLATYDFSAPASIKIVHTKLSEILKRYLSRKHDGNFLNQTTGDILILLRDKYPDKDIPANAAASLRCSDAVKFAKYLPTAGETEESIRLIKTVIQAIHRRAVEQQSLTPNPKS